jgi:RNA-binding protein
MLSTKQRSFLGGLASKDAVVTHLGKGGPTAAFAAQLSLLLEHHELVKVKFVNFKDDKRTIADDLATATKSEVVRLIGNTAIFYKQNPDPEKRAIELT